MSWHIHLATTPSTMAVAHALAAQGAPHMSLVGTSHQTKGRGRQGKVWQTYPNTAFAGTFIVRQGQGPHLALITSLSLHQTCTQVCPSLTPNLHIKWPNDMLKNTDKIAGILVEKKAQNYTLIGIGCNVNPPPEPSSYMHLTDSPISLFSFARTLSACLTEHLHLYSQHGWSAFAAEYASKCATIGQKISWQKTPTEQISGQVLGLTEDGALELEDEHGAKHLIHAGEIVAQA